MAAQTVTAYMRCQISLSEVLTSGLSNTAASPSIINPTFEYTTGNSNTSLAINQAFAQGYTTVTLNAGSSITYTMTSLTDAMGRTISFANGVRTLVFYTTSRTAGDYLAVGNAASNAWTGIVSSGTATLNVYDFAAFSVGSTDKYTVTANSSEQLKITNAGSNPITFKWTVWGNT